MKIIFSIINSQTRIISTEIGLRAGKIATGSSNEFNRITVRRCNLLVKIRLTNKVLMIGTELIYLRLFDTELIYLRLFVI